MEDGLRLQGLKYVGLVVLILVVMEDGLRHTERAHAVLDILS